MTTFAPALSLLVAIATAEPSPEPAVRDIYVNAQTGDDANDASAAAPLATAQKAIAMARSGDTIHLLPEGSILRQMILLAGKQGITIDGHGSTLTGADPLPADGWENAGPDLSRRRMPQQDRHLLIVDGKLVRMGRSPSVQKPFPAPDKLQPGEFAWVPIDKAHAWLYVRGPVDKLQWSARQAGVATSGTNRDITIRNLNCRHALNDGFNIHGDCRGLRCRKIAGYENFDEGFSAHDTCQCWIDEGRFWGNDNAVADVNWADSFYKHCEFRDSVSVEVLFSGGKHSLDDCKIVAGGKTAISIGPGGYGRKSERPSPVECVLRNCTVESVDQVPRPVLLADATVTLEQCTLQAVKLSIRRCRFIAKQSTLDRRPLPVP